MINFEKYLKPEEMSELKKAISEQPGLLTKIEQHMANQLYKDANFAWQRTQVKQIIKGAEKYPEPLNPFSWTGTELVEHALQESVDQVHYLTGLLAQIKELELWADKYKEDAIYWKNKYHSVCNELDKARSLEITRIKGE
jgi:hypothetical protein